MKLHHNWTPFGAALAFLAVLMGTFGAHGLEGYLEGRASDPADLAKRLEWWGTAVDYHLVHGPALVLLGLFQLQRAPRGALDGLAGWCLLFGTVVFSGLLVSSFLSLFVVPAVYLLLKRGQPT